jgi:uncharacterized membrane protein YkvA (DUF1232 family)
MLERTKQWARNIKRDVLALWIAARDPRVPWTVKALAMAIAAYALSPIDLIPDFIPVLGYLDELILLPLAILLVVKLIPAPLMAEFRAEAERRASRPRSTSAAAVIVALWLTAAVLLLWWLWPTPAAKPQAPS